MVSTSETRIVVTRTPPGRAIAMLEAAGDVWLWTEDRVIPRDVFIEQTATAQAVYTMLTDTVDEELLDAAPHLGVVSNMAVGMDNIDVDACTVRNVVVGHTPGVLADTVADTAMGLLLMAARRLVEGVDYVRSGSWGPWDPNLLLGRDIHGSTVGIIGLGGVGAAVARRLAGFTCKLLYWNRKRHPEAEERLGVVYAALPELLAQSDHVVVAVALAAETHHLIDRDALATMKPTASLVNVSRGGTVDQKALAEALADGTIAAAALDVTDPEPIDMKDPLLELSNCVIIPHLGSSSEQTRRAMAEMAAENLIAGLQDTQMPASPNQQLLRDVTS